MGRFNGVTFPILCGKKGIDNNLNINAVAPDALIWPSKNISLSDGGWGRRKGTAKHNGTAVPDTPRIMALFDFLKVGAQHLVFSTSDGKVYRTASNTIATGLGATKYGHFESFDGELYFVNGYNVPKSWNGAGNMVDFTQGVASQGTITMSGHAVAAAKSQGTITMSGIATAGETFTVDELVFVWQDIRLGKRGVTIGATAAEAVTNIVEAINADLETVDAEDGAGNTVVLTARDYGIIGDNIVFTEMSTNLAIDGGGSLGGTTAGVDGETFKIDEQTFTWVPTRDTDDGEGEVTVGATAAAAVTNIVAAIAADLKTVTAIDGAGDTVIVTAAVVGLDGDAIDFTESSTNMAVNGTGHLGGTTAGVEDQLPTDWAGTNYPSVMIRHGKGNSERMWAFGCSGNPYTIYASETGNGKHFSDADVITLNIDTGDNAGIVGGVVYKDNLIVFGYKNTFIIDDADTNTNNWGYTAFAREGGAAHQRLIVQTPNDVIIMTVTGEIYSLVAAEQYGDFKAASITRPKFMDRWIRDNVRLSYIEHFHGEYDPVKRVVKIFVVRKDQTTVDTAMVYYIDTGEWMIEDNLDHVSGYSASCSAKVKVTTGQYEVWTGGYSGFIWKLEQEAKNDENAGYESKILGPYLYFGDGRTDKLFYRAWIDLEPNTDFDLTIRYYVGDIFADSVVMTGTGGILDTFVLGVTILGISALVRKNFPIGRIDDKIQFEITNSTANEEFFIVQIMVDFKNLGSTL